MVATPGVRQGQAWLDLMAQAGQGGDPRDDVFERAGRGGLLSALGGVLGVVERQGFGEDGDHLH